MNTRERILVIEDEAAISELILENLSLDFDVDAVDSCALAEAKLTSSRYDLILSDIQLPDGLSLDLMKKLAVNKKNIHETPILFMTGNLDRNFIKDALKLGAVGFLDKPFSMAQLRTSIYRVMAINCSTTSSYKQLLKLSL